MRDVYFKQQFFEKYCVQNMKVPFIIRKCNFQDIPNTLYTLPRLTLNKIEKLSILNPKLKLGVNIDSVHSTYTHYNCTRFYRVDIIPEMNLGVITSQ